LADLSAKAASALAVPPVAHSQEAVPDQQERQNSNGHPNSNFGSAGLHYNIQIHLPATKDTEVYDAIFKSLKEHLFE
jgi:hypothetical protein